MMTLFTQKQISTKLAEMSDLLLLWKLRKTLTSVETWKSRRISGFVWRFAPKYWEVAENGALSFYECRLCGLSSMYCLDVKFPQLTNTV